MPLRRIRTRRSLVGLGALAMGAAIWLHAIWPLTQIGYDFRMYLAAAHDRRRMAAISMRNLPR